MDRLPTPEERIAQEKQDQIEARRETQLREDCIALLQQASFVRVMRNIIARGGMFQSVMTGNSHTYHKSGRQDFCREIYAILAEADRDAAFELLKPEE